MLTSTPEDAKQTAYEFLDRSETAYDLVLTDLPGTVNAAGVFRSLVNMDYLFVPVTQNRMVMQSSMNFVLAIRELLSRNDSFPLKDIRLFWNCMDRRVSKELYRAYTEIFRQYCRRRNASTGASARTARSSAARCSPLRLPC